MEVSLPYLQETAIGPFPEPAESSLSRCHTLFFSKTIPTIILLSAPRSPTCSFALTFTEEIVFAFAVYLMCATFSIYLVLSLITVIIW
jgi:hypothetical protein